MNTPKSGSPARSDPAAAFEMRWRRFHHTWKKAQQELSAEVVHELRVSTRRLLAALEVYRSLEDGSDLKRCRRFLEELLTVSSPLRDAQIHQAWLTKTLSTNPELAEFETHIAKRERKARKRVEAAMSTAADFPRVLTRAERKFDAVISAASPAVLKSAAEHVARREFTELRNELSSAVPEDPRSVHRVRIALKRFRYARELTVPNRRAMAGLRSMENLQTQLGEIHDTDVLLCALGRWSEKDERRIGNLGGVLSTLKTQWSDATGKFFQEVPKHHLMLKP